MLGRCPSRLCARGPPTPAGHWAPAGSAAPALSEWTKGDRTPVRPEKREETRADGPRHSCLLPCLRRRWAARGCSKHSHLPSPISGFSPGAVVGLRLPHPHGGDAGCLWSPRLAWASLPGGQCQGQESQEAERKPQVTSAGLTPAGPQGRGQTPPLSGCQVSVRSLRNHVRSKDFAPLGELSWPRCSRSHGRTKGLSPPDLLLLRRAAGHRVAQAETSSPCWHLPPGSSAPLTPRQATIRSASLLSSASTLATLPSVLHTAATGPVKSFIRPDPSGLQTLPWIPWPWE